MDRLLGMLGGRAAGGQIIAAKDALPGRTAEMQVRFLTTMVHVLSNSSFRAV